MYLRSDRIYDALIVGAGACGLAAAAFALRSGSPTIALLEGNDVPAKKIYASGNGRCNVLNSKACAKDYRSAQDASEGERFAQAVLESCGPRELEGFFESIGIECVQEEGGRLYPRSMQASSVAKALVSAAAGADIALGFKALSALRDEDGCFRVISSDGREARGRKLLLAGGGKAGIQYGSDGSCLKMAQSFGHSAAKPIPALTGLVCEGCADMAGVRVSGAVRLMVLSGGKEREAARSSGEIQFAKDYVSGICVMDVSGAFRTSGGESFYLSADFMPGISRETLEEKLSARKRRFGDFFLDALLPIRLAETLCGMCGGDAGRLSELIKDMRFPVSASLGWKYAQSTSGGISLFELDPGSMESRIEPGLYIAGEMTDIDGPCGGYNLTWAFATGCIAGRSLGRMQGA